MNVAATPVDGSYTMTSTIDQLIAAGAPPQDIVEENYGTFVIVLDRGRFAFNQEQGAACTWGYGRFDLNGPSIVLDFDDGGGQAPNGAANRPDEHFEYGWSLYRETLGLTPVTGAISPEYLRGRWARTGPADAGALIPRCLPPAAAFR